MSYSWAYSDSYKKLINLLDNDCDFSYEDYSIPKDNPLHVTGSDNKLRWAIHEQMKHASVVLILAGVYSTYSKWINIEIDLAKNGLKKTN
ncbi:MAG: TIR domain-containing protein [Methanocorpusculum sp.]|nr:TIR domain-containing protein [Methanocorpusculum sp.]